MNGDEQKSPPLTKEALLAGRRYEELSDSEKALYGKLGRQAAREGAQRIVDNLNRQTATKH